MEDGSVNERPTIGILYPGELGSTVGRLLARWGLTVVTTVAGRSERSKRLAEDAGLTILSSLHEVAQRADIVLSTVSPAAALPIAEQYLPHVPRAKRPLYVDLNSTSPNTARNLERIFHSRGVDFVDGALHGLASGLPERGTIYLSGAAAPRLTKLLAPVLRVKVLGNEAGQASTFKMLISGLAKGVAALFVEMSLAARHAGLLDDLLACYRQAYPGIMELVERLLPTYPQHAARRAEEAREVEQTLLALGLRPCLATGTRELTQALAAAHLGEGIDKPTPVRELIEALATRGVLERDADEEHSLSRFPLA